MQGRTAVPVSYTHLDVYKRQGPLCGVQAQGHGDVGDLRPGGQHSADVQALSGLQLAAQGGPVIKEDEVGPGLPAHVGLSLIHISPSLWPPGSSTGTR